MKIGILQLNTTAGDFVGNARKILEAAKDAAARGADFAVCPEAAISGLPLKDLVKYKQFVQKARGVLLDLAAGAPLPILVGCPSEGDGRGTGVYNSAFWLENGAIKAVYHKRLLPNYGAWNDPRIFDAGAQDCVVSFKGKRIGVTICEDIWSLPDVETAGRYAGSATPLDFYARLKAEGNPVDFLVNISASVFSNKNDNIRGQGGMLWNVSRHVGAPVIWCNLVGGNDEYVFAGGSCCVDAQRGVSASLKKFCAQTRVIDTESLSSFETACADYNGVADTHAALVLALRDFINKVGVKKVLIGLSGGIDSALVAALAVEALGKERVMGVSMPSKISSRHSRDDARALAENLGIDFHTVGIAEIVESIEGALAPLFAGRARDVAEENIQSRARGVVLMAISNKFGALVLTTGNKSECAVGYCTLYGDTCGGFAPICDVYKTDVYKISNYINQKAGREVIPQNTIDKPPSAELRPGQKDEDSLPPYDLFDSILRLHIDAFKSVSEIVELGFDRAVVEDVASKVARAEYKRTQYPIGPKLSAVAYATDRKIPVAIKRGTE